MTNLEALTIYHGIQRKLLALNQLIDLKSLENPDMPVSPVVADIISKFDVATSAIAARIQNLVNAAPSLSAEDQAAFQTEIDKLTALGADPNNPVPTA